MVIIDYFLILLLRSSVHDTKFLYIVLFDRTVKNVNELYTFRFT